MNKKNIIIVFIILLILILLYIFLSFFLDNDSDYEDYLKNYKVNEYIPSYISNEDMAKIYLKDYIHIMFTDVESAYNLLDEEYRNKKFGSLENYKKYVNEMTELDYTLSKYYKKEINSYIIFGVYDQKNNFYAFKTKGVMQYKVYLDDYTVEIW